MAKTLIDAVREGWQVDSALRLAALVTCPACGKEFPFTENVHMANVTFEGPGVVIPIEPPSTGWYDINPDWNPDG